jgi:hypothetical protein
MILALIGSAACNYISNLNIQAENRIQAKKYEKTFERHAIEVLENCCLTDRKNTRYLLTRTHQHWGELSAIEIAVNGHSQAFLAHNIVQVELDRIWWGKIRFRTIQKDPYKYKYKFWIIILIDEDILF